MKKKSRVPTTRLGRLARQGMTAGELAIGGVVESARRLGKAKPEDAYNVLLTATNAKKLASRLAGMRGAAMPCIRAEVNGDLRIVLAAPWNIEGNEVMGSRMKIQIDFSGIQLLQVS